MFKHLSKEILTGTVNHKHQHTMVTETRHSGADDDLVTYAEILTPEKRCRLHLHFTAQSSVLMRQQHKSEKIQVFDRTSHKNLQCILNLLLNEERTETLTVVELFSLKHIFICASINTHTHTHTHTHFIYVHTDTSVHRT